MAYLIGLEIAAGNVSRKISILFRVPPLLQTGIKHKRQQNDRGDGNAYQSVSNFRAGCGPGTGNRSSLGKTNLRDRANNAGQS
jgi:hypothetical protein